MASSSSSSQPKDKSHAFSGIEPESIRRKVSESARLYDVFINHRGPDSKQILALPLYDSLKELGIRVFLDKEELELGQSFPSAIETAIGSAAVHIAIFSKRYAESPWCLAELVLMLHSPAKIIPVFYEVEPWELRHIEKGVYADAFIEYQKKSRYLNKLKQWKEALQSISFTTGHEMNNSNIGDHKSILSAVQREVQRIKPLHVAKYPVALDKLVHDFERECLQKLVQDFEINCGMKKEGRAKIMGIFGMGGVGKTTLSKELFNRKRQQYARACFLFDVREASRKNNLSSLQRKVLKDLFDEDGLNFQSTEEGSSCICNCIERNTSLSFLIVLDDIDHLEQLDALSITSMLKKLTNSLVIITTRDVGILIAEGIKVGYHVKGMDIDDARLLFSWHAFSQPHPASGYEDLVEDFLGVCGGLHLSLQVLGRHVHGRDENYWRSELQKLGRTMHQDIRISLKISFDSLSREEKQIFMDIACFFVDQLKSIAVRVWNASGWSAQNSLQALKDKCLVEEIEDPVPVLRMHDHLRDLGREMANDLNQPHRLWRSEDLKQLESKGFENIFTQTKGRCFHSFFDKLLNFEVQFFIGNSDNSAVMSPCLLWLQLWYPYIYSGSNSSNLNNLWHSHHASFSVHPTIPSWIPLQNMRCLRISNGYLKRLWQQDAEAPSEMKKLEIHGTFLEEYPDFLGVLTNVEKEINEGQHISKTKSLMVRTCRRLSGSLPRSTCRKSSTFKAPFNGGSMSATVKAPLSLLEDLVIKEQENIKRIVLNGNYCPRLQSLELSSLKDLIEVQFTRVETLNCLNISKCEYLKILSVTSDLTELEELSICACPMLEEPNFGSLTCLKKIRIAYCNMISVPGMSSFKMLVELNVSRCPNIHELCLAHLSSLEKLIVKDCDNLKSVTGLSHLLKLVELSISWCWMLELDLCLVGLSRLKRITVDRFVKVKCFELKGCINLETVAGISFKMICVVNICGCPELKNFPSICSPSCLELIKIDGCGKLNRLMLTNCGALKRVSGNIDLVVLSILDCPMLEELPCFGIYLEKIQILRCGNLQSMTLPTTLKRLELNACRGLRTILTISALTELVELNILGCPQLEFSIADLILLDKMAIANLKNLSGISNLTKLVELEFFQCVEFEHELRLSSLCCLKRIAIVECGNMHMITLPTNLTTLTLEDCRDLESMVGISGLTKLAGFNIKNCPQLRLELQLSSLNPLKRITIVECWNVYNITLPTTLMELTVQRCRAFQIKAGIGDLTKLAELCISECPEIEELPVVCGLSSLERITIDGCGKFNYLHVSDCAVLKVVRGNFDMGHLAQLWIWDCPELEELPCFAHLTCLEEIRIFRCMKLQKVTLPTTLKNLHLGSCKELKSMSNISRNKSLVELIISDCGQLELEPRLDDMDSLRTITFDGCGKLESFRLNKCKNLKRVSGNFDVEWLSICDCPKVEELSIGNCPGMKCLETIYIKSCDKLQHITLPAKLIKLVLQRCRHLPRIAGKDGLTELCISEFAELDELPSLAGLSCLVRIKIDSCQKLHSMTLPTALNELSVHRCRGLQVVKEMGYLKKLTKMSISECPELEELPILPGLTCLKMIVIDSCEKLQKIMLPTTLIKLTVRRCRRLQRVEIIGNLTKLKDICISECPELEDLPIFTGLSCLKMLAIDYCEKLCNIILPTTLFKLTVSRYRGSQLLAAISNLTKLEELSIFECPELEELPGFAKLSRLKMIAINSCEKLHNVTLPTTLIKLTLQRCKELQRVAGIDYLIKLEFLDISECPKVELPCLAGLSCLKNVSMDSCEKLENIVGIEELQALEALQLQYCSNAAIQDCIPKLKRVPSAFIQLVGRAADGAKSNLHHSLLSEAYLCHSDIWHSTSAIIICGIVVVRSCDPLHTINESLKDCAWKFNLRPGEWIITTIITHQNYRRLYWQFYILSEQGIMKKWCAWGVKKGEDWRTRRALITIIDKLHQK